MLMIYHNFHQLTENLKVSFFPSEKNFIKHAPKKCISKESLLSVNILTVHREILQLNCSLFAVGSALFVPLCLWRPDARIASPYGKAASVFEAEIFELQLKWQSKHITSNVVQHKYGICMHCFKHRAAGI